MSETSLLRAGLASASHGRLAFAMLFLISLTACETMSKPLPSGYTGPTATIKDSANVTPGKTCGDFFFLYQYAGKDVDNMLQASARDNAGSGAVIYKVNEFSRPVPAHEATFYIAGRTHCAAPIMELVGTTHVVGGNIVFTPAADTTYVIKGELAPDHSVVWLENEKNGQQVGNKLLINGPAKIGFFEAVSGKVVEIPPPATQ